MNIITDFVYTYTKNNILVKVTFNINININFLNIDETLYFHWWRKGTTE